MPSSNPRAGRRPADPIASPAFVSLRAVAWSLAEPGLTPVGARAPADEARIAAYFVISELLRLLDAFGAACLRGEAVRLAVTVRRGARSATVEIEIRAPDEPRRP